ncbi:cytochrome b/b6 domain-containing protein [Erythrobacter sp. Alg231-14]|uniref:cytochrome b/b6 domain-containing protein n=1 Tax=Erythrobacter sp. Alg231-14 TaxID=1922225 RepID=UPI000D54F332
MPESNYDSWIAIAIVAISVLTAWLMNTRAPKVRAFGTLLAALGCFAVVVWFANILGTGVLENPKPNQTPMDSAKPVLMWGQAGMALLAGVMLSWAALKQFGNTEQLELSAANEAERYGRVSRLLHWTTAMLFISLFPIGMFASMIPEDAWFRNQYYVIHKSIGVLVFILLIVRLVWNQRSKRPDLDSSLKPVERRWAHRVHIALYGMLLAMPLTGYMMTSYHGFPTYFFGLEFEPFWGKSDAYIVWGTFHKYLFPYLLYIVLGAHILGALKHHFVDRHAGALKRMVS